jgi:hypothetical protein
MNDQKIDAQDMVKRLERIMPRANEPLNEDLAKEVSTFFYQVARDLPELARVYQQHDDVCRAIIYLSEHGFAITAELLPGASHSTDAFAAGIIKMARQDGWKPPREDN